MAQTSFNVALRALLSAATEAHEHSNVLQGQLFADERGWLKDAERAEMELRQAKVEELCREIDERIKHLATEHPASFRAYLERGAEVFEAIASGAFISIRRGTAALERDRPLASSLASSWNDMILGQAGKYSISWALAVGSELLLTYGELDP